MQIHGRAKLGPAGRLALTQAVTDGMTLRQAAGRFGVSVATAHRWWHRRLDASSDELASGVWLFDRSSRPRRSPRLLDAIEQERICEARRHTGWGPRLVAGRTGHPHSTVWKVLHRHGLSRVKHSPREPARRYEWPCPGDLLHMDTARHARFERPGHAVTGVRNQTGAEKRAAEKRTGRGYDFAHAVIDDHSRLVYVELLDDERAATVTAFTTRALDWFAARGIHAKRLMTDNAWVYVRNQSLRELLRAREIKHLRTQAYRPQTNGKIERFHQTMAREWAYGMSYRSHRHRNQALPHWLEHYNTRRPHSGIGNRPPISRVHNLRGQDT
jgi:transposase InsO family protein